MICRKYVQIRLFSALLLCLLFPAVSPGETLVGVLFSGNIAYYRDIHVALLNELKSRKPPGMNIKYINQFPAPDPVSWSNAAKKFVIGGVDLIISYGYPATSAVLAKESDIPTLYVGVYNPEPSINDGRVTGCGYQLPVADLMEYCGRLGEFARLAVIYSPVEEGSVRMTKELARLADQQNKEIVRLDFRTPGDLKKLDDLASGDAVFMTGSTMAHILSKDILSALLEKKIPVVDIFPDSAKEGALIALYQDPQNLGKRAAEMAARLLTGEQIEQIDPVVVGEPSLILNVGRARKLGYTIPPDLLSKATKVIE